MIKRVKTYRVECDSGEDDPTRLFVFVAEGSTVDIELKKQGWRIEYDEETNEHRQFCPLCTRVRVS